METELSPLMLSESSTILRPAAKEFDAARFRVQMRFKCTSIDAFCRHLCLKAFTSSDIITIMTNG